MTELQLSISPRATWLWAPDSATARHVREMTAGRPAVRDGHEVPLVTDIDVGADALQACEPLAAAGYTFTWHESEHPLNQYGWPAGLPGMPTS